ncbi:dTDP-4-dehydrorhamnose 3,5-epimerase [Paracnuella aquatica]|uniref:dTDP-4-dehydrorhamnose 3,5-epimerase n=1 Tax=Paracnuella aquatica TaxID=2268757 RepID=UPI000DEEB193|nr:dTDP-4-dehydrorhamnose 3,5-epimerase [Paracnuella aquatica]RPD50712.1 dTDP-4-dehydrorhamnose 3,5-epimerase [Paracnuella aquatica]
MLFETCAIPGLVIVTPKLFQDSRGYFFESYNRKPFVENGITADFVQDNQSRSTYGVIRGLHYQRHPFAQAKLVRVLQGTILDVAVDIREGSPTFGQHFAIELSDENCKQLYLPAGFSHGFSVLSETAVVSYKCDQYYNKESEGGIRFDDPALGIDWWVPTANAIVSDKDLLLPVLSEAHHNFTF